MRMTMFACGSDTDEPQKLLLNRRSVYKLKLVLDRAIHIDGIGHFPDLTITPSSFIATVERLLESEGISDGQTLLTGSAAAFVLSEAAENSRGYTAHRSNLAGFYTDVDLIFPVNFPENEVSDRFDAIRTVVLRALRTHMKPSRRKNSDKRRCSNALWRSVCAVDDDQLAAVYIQKMFKVPRTETLEPNGDCWSILSLRIALGPALYGDQPEEQALTPPTKDSDRLLEVSRPTGTRLLQPKPLPAALAPLAEYDWPTAPNSRNASPCPSEVGSHSNWANIVTANSPTPLTAVNRNRSQSASISPPTATVNRNRSQSASPPPSHIPSGYSLGHTPPYTSSLSRAVADRLVLPKRPGGSPAGIGGSSADSVTDSGYAAGSERSISPESDRQMEEVYADSVYEGGISEAIEHLENRQIVLPNPENVRGGGLIKYCNLLVQGYTVLHDSQLSLESRMLARFHLDHPTLDSKWNALANYVNAHFAHNTGKGLMFSHSMRRLLGRHEPDLATTKESDHSDYLGFIYVVREFLVEIRNHVRARDKLQKRRTRQKKRRHRKMVKLYTEAQQFNREKCGRRASGYTSGRSSGYTSGGSSGYTSDQPGGYMSGQPGYFVPAQMIGFAPGQPMNFVHVPLSQMSDPSMTVGSVKQPATFQPAIQMQPTVIQM
eukprot:140109_1